jgi:hypothetical protein
MVKLINIWFISNKYIEKVTSLVGSSAGYKDGQGEIAQLNYPRGVCFNPNNNCLYVCDQNNGLIRKVTLEGIKEFKK